MSFFKNLVARALITLGLVAAPTAAVHLIYDDNDSANDERVILTVRDADTNEVLSQQRVTSNNPTVTAQIPYDQDQLTYDPLTGGVSGTRRVKVSAKIVDLEADPPRPREDVIFPELGDETGTSVEVDLSSTQPKYVVVSNLDEGIAVAQVVDDPTGTDINGDGTPEEVADAGGIPLP